MSLAGLVLVLCAAVCHATWNFFVKRVGGGAELIWLFSLVTVVIYLPLPVWILVTQDPDLSLWPVIFIIGSVLLHLGYFLILQIGYRHGDLSLVYPIARSTGPLLSSTFAVVFLGEIITVQMAAGALLIVFGVLMLTGGIRPGARHVTLSLLFGLATGTFIGSYTAWDAYAVSVLLVPPIILDYSSSLGRVLLLSPMARRKWHEIGRHWAEHRKEVILIALFNPLAYILVLYALTFTPVAFVAPTREVSVLLSVLAGSILLKEGQLGRRLGWAVIILTGMGVLLTA
ncbi:DMT family transporter [Ovoidimarina sediminis]|uniref:DMT family transporter n=1 Tax=Ovoidimarina sediminis TaxID=3079856 RepID=UPI00290AD2DC|nr:DMT family transporter [Rhodophyticola sp. MJ-SS7]MDU8943969.1 DMT family transporter [Rhodophyticola sp. MJ-SS7]